MSHLLQMRGLKPIVMNEFYAGSLVASFTDAWIETVKSGWLREWREGRIFYRCVD